jgi:penicillin-insensitive murein endopeptidase
LFNAVQMPADDRWELVDSANAWGTLETIEYLSRAIVKVHEQFPNSPKLYIGHISARLGGQLAPHVSHQAGRDVDISYFYTAGARWYARADNHNLDLPRTWAFVRALISETDVDLLLIDHSIQNLLLAYARRIGENEEWLRDVFQGRPGKLRALVLHAKGHATHIHVRFYNPTAEESARRLHDALIKHGAVRAPVYYVSHTVKPGETLGMLSRKYNVSVKVIRSANGLRSNLIRARKTYRIPKSGGVRPRPGPVVLPARRLPPARSTTERPAISLRVSQ